MRVGIDGVCVLVFSGALIFLVHFAMRTDKRKMQTEK